MNPRLLEIIGALVVLGLIVLGAIRAYQSYVPPSDDEQRPSKKDGCCNRAGGCGCNKSDAEQE